MSTPISIDRPDPAKYRALAGPYHHGLPDTEYLRRAVAQLAGCRFVVHGTREGGTIIYRHVEEYRDRAPSALALQPRDL